MKKLKLMFMLLSLFIIVLNCNAQYSKESNAILVPIGIIMTTALTVELMSKSHDTQTLDAVGVTGIAISVMSLIIIDTVKKNTPKKVRRKRIKKLTRL